MNTIIITLSGPAGSGKGTIAARLIQQLPQLHLAISYTTRAQENDPPGAYRWLTGADRSEQFMALVAAGAIIEHNDYAGAGELYGSPAPVEGLNLYEIDVNGVRQIRQRYPNDVISIMVVPPGATDEQRLLVCKARMETDPNRRRSNIEGRLRTGATELLSRYEICHADGRSLIGHVVENDDSDRALRQIIGILEPALEYC